MASVNKNYNKLQGAYLFSEIAKRAKDFMEKNPGIEIMRLGIGDTILPLTPTVIKGLKKGVEKLAKIKTYTGYGDTQGDIRLRNALVDFYKKRKIDLDQQEIFISDGAKSDSANIQSIFGLDNVVAIADPVYPVYLDSAVIAGRTGKFANGKYENLVYMECNEKNNFIPSPPKQKVDIIYLCNPNNPTGAVATKKQLKDFVDYALKNKAVIIFDAAYVEYISDESFPKSIYEIEGAKKCAIEINSFSKWAGFTGVRLGWTVVPMDLIAEEVKEGKINNVWARRQGSMFNGASNIAQEGALAALSVAGQKESKKIIAYYMSNATLIKKNLLKLGLKVFGGEHAPYIWLKNPDNLSSWEFFNKLLKEAHVVVTPGSGFGTQGEGYVRLTAFGNKQDIKKAIESIQESLKL
ncbi:LL-diaminopimelate aminotransferase [Candidatus Nomurabacteria bacterium RIFCSPHIGHO2_01_FULL_37_25]|uniref:LL-diaminopimelate aminotransferase n=1 Tax=Candidatus Nomurabacteria bacterium RIFCSPLOWO2_01_FULL_36_16 TaxID=1801767 RepID=A0A1F6WZ97_9BACT|nr:MAG: LL-diaminopimelate aminotransferase [Candidatus Nomurabacteria bacterium RIFCSPHIGHO2_01_FULL_37_25]OGI75357.1 MAG: LL-diaminopimelate aminotransferase [Candidatus Nomurabacteria bacterium RIFCSPHIGHO2_02_FULL_36_29]OGI87104.1 MAG: LL-diaminopimelate aminotransferase [Candidatus Nomurabacteria bacterium RIFCSPLOWO2_01_FULL_36_16]OGI95259.1 MAG: LL-diaminopimelate aminotransferase [Candidatus Nomurabacteria bacterium RIFCSPLOWO2_02_FULL_36_8]